MENLCTTHPTVIAFMVRDVMSLKSIFSIFLLAGLIDFMVYFQICYWISKQVFYSTEILFFILSPRYGYFEVRHVSRSKLDFCPSESYLCIRVWDVLEGSLKFNVLPKAFFKSTKWSLDFFQKPKMNVPLSY